MPPDAEAVSPPGYSGAQAVLDLLGGARYARRPVRRRAGAPVPWGWLALLTVLSGLAWGLDIYLREPFRADELPAEWRSHLWLANTILLPLMSIAGFALSAGLFVLGARILLGGRASTHRLATAIVLGGWSAVLPMLLVAGIGGGVGIPTDLVATVNACVLLGYIAPSLAETAGVSVGRALGSVVLGLLFLTLLLVAAALAFGFGAKIAGFRP